VELFDRHISLDIYARICPNGCSVLQHPRGRVWIVL